MRIIFSSWVYRNRRICTFQSLPVERSDSLKSANSQKNQSFLNFQNNKIIYPCGKLSDFSKDSEFSHSITCLTKFLENSEKM